MGEHLYYTTEDNIRYENSVLDLEEIKNGDSRIMAEVAASAFGDDDDDEWYDKSPSPSGGACISFLFTAHLSCAKSEVVCVIAPGVRRPFYSANLLYVKISLLN